jgi:hypothetical protein
MMPARYKTTAIVICLVTGGIALGAVTAPLFAPVPKVPFREPLAVSGRSHLAQPHEPQPWVEPRPEVVAHDTFVPDEGRAGPIWQYPAPAYEPWEPEPTFPLDDADISGIFTAWETANAAEEAAEAAAAADALQPETVRKSDLANGLY